jgi:hypothetical protein
MQPRSFRHHTMPSPEQFSTEEAPRSRAEKMRAAEHDVCVECPKLFEQCDRELAETAAFSRSGREYIISSAQDTLYAKAQAYHNALKNVQEAAEGDNDRYRAKYAAQYAQGFKSVADLIAQYPGEVEENGPLAQLLETLKEDLIESAQPQPLEQAA